jgi:mercuric ion transport protein
MMGLLSIRKDDSVNRKRLVAFGLVGATLTALCCFTPILAGLLGLVGLGAVIGSLDYVLLPALVAFVGLALYGVLRRNPEGTAGCRRSPSVKGQDHIGGT